MSRRRLGAALVAASLNATGALAADDPALASLIAEAVGRSPDLAAARQLLAAAETRPAQVGSRPGPTVGLLYTNDGIAPSLGSVPMTTLSLMAAQELPYPDKRNLRRRVTLAEVDAVRQEVERTRLTVVSEVRRAYYGYQLAVGLAALAEEQRGVWSEVQESARVRYASAAGPQSDVLRAQVEGTRLQALHAQHHAEARAQLTELERLVGRPVETTLETAGVLREVAPERRTLDELAAWAEASSPELRAAAAAVERDQRAVALARREFSPDFTVQAAYMNRGTLEPMWQAGVTVAFPSRTRVRSALAEAEARLAAGRAALESLRLRLRAMVERRLTRLGAAEEIERVYREGILPQGQVAVESALARYRAAQDDQVGVLQAMAAMVEDRTDYLRLLAGHAIERARLEELSLDEGMEGLEPLLMHGRTGMPDRGGMRSRTLLSPAPGASKVAETR
jgi:cobalt-zinc-cadmium efflux system outer membrane protein